MKKQRKKAYIGKNCVACGCCVKVCPLQALSVYSGVTAMVNEEKCVGCGKCMQACPAGIIDIKESEEHL